MFFMQLIYGIHWNTNVSQPKRVTRNKWGTWFNKNRVSYESKCQKKKNPNHQPIFRVKWTLFSADSTHVCLLKWNFLHQLLRFLVSWPHDDQAEILLNAPSEIIDLKQVLLRRAVCRRFCESPQKQGSMSTFCNTESSHIIPVF